MSLEPYQPPAARLGDKEAQAQGSIVKALFLGALVALAATTLASIALVFIFSFIYKGEPEQIAGHLQQSVPFMALDLLIGTALLVYAGYLTANIANRKEYLLASILSTMFMVYLAWNGLALLEELPLWYGYGGVLLAFAAPFAGAFLWIRERAGLMGEAPASPEEAGREGG